MNKIIIIIFCAAALIFNSCENKKPIMETTDKNDSGCSASCEAKSASTAMSCKLTSPELQKRKATIIAALKEAMIDKKELINGYAYKFKGDDAMVDQLADFIKTERECCDFFTFNVSVSGDKSEAWLELKGPEGAKDFIDSELEF